MHRIYGSFSNGDLAEATSQDFSFRDVDQWGDYAGGRSLVVLFGDETAGPFAFFSSMPPMDDEMERAFAHGHDADNWRISVQGTTNMGNDTYLDGQFRYQDGGVPYPGDNVAWGPDGGFGLVMFGDRRGFPIRPVKASIAEKVVPEQLAAASALGIAVEHPLPDAPAIATTEGGTERGHRNDGFESAAEWTELVPGVRCSAALLGDRECGPMLLHLDADAGAQVLPAHTAATEFLMVLARGSMTSTSGAQLGLGDLRVAADEHARDGFVAGKDGVQLTIVIGDRQAVDGIEVGDDGAAWHEALVSMRDALAAQLATA